MDKSKALAGGALYAVLVFLPTVHLLAVEYSWENPILERIAIGVGAILAGNLVWDGLRGPRDPMVLAQRPRRYWGIQPVWFTLALVGFYLAWFSNAPNAFAGATSPETSPSLFGATQPLKDLWPRIVEAAMTHASVFILIRGIKTTKTPEQRRMNRQQRKAKKAAKKGAYAAPVPQGRVRVVRKPLR